MAIIALLPALETPALVLREMVREDADAMARYMTRDAYRRHIALRFASAAEVHGFVRRGVARQAEGRRRSFHLAAECKLRRIAVGDGFILLDRGNAEIGWGVDPALWGHGLGKEIGRALTAIAIERLGAEKVWAKVMAANAASLRVARAIGLKHAKSHADYPAGGGRFEPVEIFTLKAEDYFEASY